MADNHFLEQVLPTCRLILDNALWTKLSSQFDPATLDALPELLQQIVNDQTHLAFLPDLARLEIAIFQVAQCKTERTGWADVEINPCLQLLALQWKHLCSLILDSRASPSPEPEPELILVWPGSKGRVLYRPALNNDILALKLIVEDISVPEAAARTGSRQSRIWPIIHQAVRNRVLLGKESLIRRNWNMPDALAEKYQTTDTFTLQWHLTQACDLQCRHCYGREPRKPLDVEKALYVLEDFDAFCRQKHVHGQVSFTGGNPMLHPQLHLIFEEAVNRGFTVGFLANPTSKEQLKSLLQKGPIAFYQISLEGLEEHNDYIRGQGHFQRSLAFLDTLRELGIYSMVMLTLTKANSKQVLDLAQVLEGRADLFTFNRLSMVGSGAYLTPADKMEFTDLLTSYQTQAKSVSGMGFKDNLFNLYRLQNDLPLFGGCTGYGCGAAFNFVALLCDGDIHACRKFPSPLGNIFDHSLEEICDSDLAHAYRQGPAECKDCPIRHVCRGCMAVIHSSGLDVFTNRDPYCFQKG